MNRRLSKPGLILAVLYLALLSPAVLAGETAHGAAVPWLKLSLKALNLAIFAWLLFRFGRQPIREMLAERRQRIDRQMHEASTALAQSQQELAAVQAEQQGLAARQAAILAEARQSGESQKQRLIERARELSELLRLASRSAAEMERAAWQRSLVLESLDGAIGQTRGQLQKELGREQQDRLVEQFVSEVGRHE